MDQQELKKLRRMVRSRDQRAKEKLESFLREIPDDLTRSLFRHYYLDGWSWQRIACEFGWTDESTPRRICKKIFSNPENPEFETLK